jgi:hypothetical protein
VKKQTPVAAARQDRRAPNKINRFSFRTRYKSDPRFEKAKFDPFQRRNEAKNNAWRRAVLDGQALELRTW